MVFVEPPVIALFGLAAALAAAGGVYRDAQRVGVARPLTWALVASVPVALAVGLYLFVSAPMIGVIMTANTGLMLYGFEREVANEEEELLEPGTLPNE